MIALTIGSAIAVTVPNTVEFMQSIAAGDLLRPGTYAKALTFTLAPTSP